MNDNIDTSSHPDETFDDDYWYDYENINGITPGPWQKITNALRNKTNLIAFCDPDYYERDNDAPVPTESEWAEMVAENIYPYLDEAEDEEKFKTRLDRVLSYINSQNRSNEDGMNAQLNFLHALAIKQRQSTIERSKVELTPQLTREEELLVASLEIPVREPLFQVERSLEKAIENSYSKACITLICKKLIDYYREQIQEASNTGKSKVFDNWSHAVCHMFEKYGEQYGKEKAISILNYDDVKLITPLVDEVVQGAIDNNKIGCSKRVLIGLAAYNAHRITPENLDEPLDMKPESLNDPEFLELIKYSELAYAFCKGKTKRDLLIGLFNDKYGISILSKLAKDIDKFKQFFRLLEEVKDEINNDINDILEHAFLFSEWGIQFEDIKRNLSLSDTTEEMPEIEGIYVDVDGTLIAFEALDDDLIESLRNLQEATGQKLYIFTGGDPETAQKRLIELGLPQDLFELPVKSKAEFKGKRLSIVVDDTRPCVQGFSAGQHFAMFWDINKSLEQE